MYRTYLRDSATQAVSEKTNTQDQSVALAAFESLVNRSDLDGQKVMAVLNRDGEPIAHHRFDVQPGNEKYWRGRIADLSEAKGSRGGPGRPSEMAGGKNVNTYLDAESIEIAKRLGNGSASKGIRIALTAYCDSR